MMMDGRSMRSFIDVHDARECCLMSHLTEILLYQRDKLAVVAIYSVAVAWRRQRAQMVNQDGKIPDKEGLSANEQHLAISVKK
jgi:hypothetical protein